MQILLVRLVSKIVFFMYFRDSFPGKLSFLSFLSSSSSSSSSFFYIMRILKWESKFLFAHLKNELHRHTYTHDSKQIGFILEERRV